jgi:hypothetical protein
MLLIRNLIESLMMLKLMINLSLQVEDGTLSIPLPKPNFDCSVSFEKTPSDYAILKIHTLPETGGDTLWASAYEAYDRFSLPYRTFLEGLTAIHSAQRFKAVAA